MAKKKSPNKENAAAEELMRMLFDRMQGESTAETLNANVIIPFAAALEETGDVEQCGVLARGAHRLVDRREQVVVVIALLVEGAGLVA